MKKTYIIPETVVSELDSKQNFLLSISVNDDASNTVNPGDSYVRENDNMWSHSWN